MLSYLKIYERPAIFIALWLNCGVSIQAQRLDFSDTLIEYFKTGEPRISRYRNDNNENVGTWIDYSAPGVLHGRIDFSNGIAESYHPNGKMSIRISFCPSYGNRTGGTYEEWNSLGEKISEGYYKNPPRLFYYSWISVAIYDQDKEITNRYGKSDSNKRPVKWPDRTFNCNEVSNAPSKVDAEFLTEVNGLLYYKEEGIPYNGIVVTYHDNNKKRAENPVVNGIKQQGREWHDTGVIMFENKQTDSGNISIRYYPNGNPQFINYEAGNLYQEYYVNGQIRTMRLLKEGLTFRYWYENGNVMTDIEIKDGRQHGTSSTWDEKGNLILKCHYKEGLLDGPSFTYLKGEVTHYVEFQAGSLHGESYRLDEDRQHRVVRNYDQGQLTSVNIFSTNNDLLFELAPSGDSLKVTKSMSDDLFVVSGTVTMIIPHCGGVYGESISQPYGGKTFGIKNALQNDGKSEILKTVHADSEGRFICVLPKGDFCFVEDRKMKPLESKLWSEKAGLYYENRGEDCYRTWWSTCDLTVQVESSHHLNISLYYANQCFTGDDPCMIYSGPWPP